MILHGNIYSKSLGMDTGISVAGPRDIGTGGPFPVVYLLHGLHGNHSHWTDNTLLPVYARDYKAIFIMPESGRSLYTDMKYGLRYFSYITDELPGICGELFNISRSPEDTAIMGGSMGGYGALKCALSKPQQYGHCAAFAPACLFLGEHLKEIKSPGGEKIFSEQFGPELLADFKAAFGDDLTSSEDDEIMTLAKKTEKGQHRPRIYTSCGSEDYLYGYNLRFSREMQKTSLDFTWEEWSGCHDWTFFDQALAKGLKWLFAEKKQFSPFSAQIIK